MLEALLVPIICIFSGGYFLAWNIIHLRDEKKLLRYLSESPKTKFWTTKFGLIKLQQFSRQIFLPFGIIVGAAILFVGFKALFVIISA